MLQKREGPRLHRHASGAMFLAFSHILYRRGCTAAGPTRLSSIFESSGSRSGCVQVIPGGRSAVRADAAAAIASPAVAVEEALPGIETTHDKNVHGTAGSVVVEQPGLKRASTLRNIMFVTSEVCSRRNRPARRFAGQVDAGAPTRKLPLAPHPTPPPHRPTPSRPAQASFHKHTHTSCNVARPPGNSAVYWYFRSAVVT